MVPGADVAGVVEASPSGSQRFAAGARVYGIKSATDPNGTLAEFVAVPESQLAATKTKKLGGRFASILNSGTSATSVAAGFFNALLGRGPAYSVTILSVKDAGEKLESVFNRLIEEGKLKPVVAAVRPLEEAAAAFAELEAGHSRGKQVIKVGEE